VIRKKLLSLEGVWAFYGDFQALFEVKVEVEEGLIVAILGANGAGKTTLLRAISGVISTRGNILFDDLQLGALSAHRRAELGLVHVPEGRGIFPYMTVLENLDLGTYPIRVRKHRNESMEKVFEMFPILRESRFRLAGSLSGGEQQMLAIGRGLMAKPKLLMLDEPSLGLAPLVVDHILDTIRELNNTGMTILLVEQLVGESLEIANQAYLLSNGRVVLSGRPEELANDDRVRSIYLGVG
jgi:branched-chain amino acid transport system ATP-binding protein